ncbi:MAG TPA: hypothetical protein PKD79_00165 [Candidatus Doudnabacteria bacterium]|nr:hypothetical protein [Candidatus Doudnabacteria bacterium]
MLFYINNHTETREQEGRTNNNEQLDTNSRSDVPSYEQELSDGQFQTTGQFWMYAIGIAPDTLCFAPDAGDQFYCFENQAEAKLMLNTNSAGKLDGDTCEQISGKASIVYSSFKEGYYNTGGGSIRLEKVSRIIEPARCTKLQ